MSLIVAYKRYAKVFRILFIALGIFLLYLLLKKTVFTNVKTESVDHVDRMQNVSPLFAQPATQNDENTTTSSRTHNISNTTKLRATESETESLVERMSTSKLIASITRSIMKTTTNKNGDIT